MVWMGETLSLTATQNPHRDTMVKRFATCLLTLLLFLWSSRLGTDGYELEYLLSAKNLLGNGSFAMASAPDGLHGIPERPEGVWILPRHNLLQVLLTVPLYLAGLPFNHLLPPAGEGLLGLPPGSLALVSLLNPLLTLIAMALIRGILIDLGHLSSTAWTAAAVYGIATMAWPYASIGMEPLQITCLLLAFRMFIRLGTKPDMYQTVLLAVSIAALMHTKISAPLIALPLALAGMIRLARGSMPRGRTLALYMGILAFAGLMWIHLYRLRSSGIYSAGFFTAFDPALIPRNLMGLLVSPGKSLPAYNPILLWCVPGVWGFLRRHREEGWVLAATGALTLLLASAWDWALIEESWGPRYAMPIVPIVLIMGAERFGIAHTSGRKLMFAAVLSVSILVQIPGVLYPNVRLLEAVHSDETSQVDLTVWIPELSPIRVGAHMIANQVRRSAGQAETSLEWHHYRGIVGMGSQARELRFETREWNRPYVLPFLAERYLRGVKPGQAADEADPGWLMPLWLGVTAVLLFGISGSILSPR